MRVLLLAGWLPLVLACQYGGTQTLYGRADNDMNFGELDVVLIDAEGQRVQAIPFVVVGQGTLPDEYGADNESYERYSVGTKIRYPFPFREGRVVVYAEGGAMVSYYQADAIGTPFEAELIAGIGAQIEIGNGWWFDLAARARHPAGNGNNHDIPEHAPDGTQAEIVIGVKKDF